MEEIWRLASNQIEIRDSNIKSIFNDNDAVSPK